MTNTNPTCLSEILPKILDPVPFLGCLGKTKEEAEEVFFDIGVKYLKDNPNVSIYSGCFITDEFVDYYSDNDELPICMCTSYKYTKLTKETKKIIRSKIKSTLFYCFNRLKQNGIEVSWSSQYRNVFYISDQFDLESVSIYKDSNTLREDFISSVYEEGKSLGVSVSVCSKLVELLEVCLQGGMYPWELDEAYIGKIYNKDKLLLLSVKQLDEILSKVKHGQHRLK